MEIPIYKAKLKGSESEEISGLLLFSEREKKDLKLLLDYFGRNDVSTFEHFAFGFIKGLLKRLEQ